MALLGLRRELLGTSLGHVEASQKSFSICFSFRFFVICFGLGGSGEAMVIQRNEKITYL